MTAGTLTYNSTVKTVEQISLEVESRVYQEGTLSRIEVWMNLDKAAEAQIDVVAIAPTLPDDDSYFKVTVAGPTTTKTYVLEYLDASTVTATAIAADLAALVNLHPDVAASPRTGANANSFSVQSVLPGANGAFVLELECVKQTDNSAIAGKITSTSTPGTGTGKVRKVGEVEISVQASQSGETSPSYPEIRLANGKWFNGAATPAQASPFGPAKFTGTVSIDALRNVS